MVLIETFNSSATCLVVSSDDFIISSLWIVKASFLWIRSRGNPLLRKPIITTLFPRQVVKAFQVPEHPRVRLNWDLLENVPNQVLPGGFPWVHPFAVAEPVFPTTLNGPLRELEVSS